MTTSSILCLHVVGGAQGAVVSGSCLEWRPLDGWRRAGRSWVERLAVGMDGHSWVSDPGRVHMSGAYPHICSAETSFAPRLEPQE